MIKLLAEVLEMTEVVEVSKLNISDAINSDFKDFEDAVQYIFALSGKKIEMIITRDKAGYRNSKIPLLNAKEALIALTN